MNTDTRDSRSPESYSTFWEPVATSPAPAPVEVPVSTSAHPQDAYLEFTEVTEGVPAKRGDRT